MRGTPRIALALLCVTALLGCEASGRARLETLPESSLMFPGSEVLADGGKEHAQGIEGATQAATWVILGTDAPVEDVLAFYETELAGGGWIGVDLLLGSIGSKQPPGNDYQGYAICQSGHTSGFRCGTILSKNKTPNYSGVHMANQRQANYLVQIGDSGGPVVSNSNRNMAVGLQSGRDSLYVAYYSHVFHVEDELNQAVRIAD